MDLPEYAGKAVRVSTPPFRFDNVNTIVFPLRAQISTLQNFVDSYLNIVPKEVGHFRVTTPYVLLMLLDYGKLAAPATNFGWFSQREVIFSIPLEWYKWTDGRWLFHDWASTTPFIYVDAEMSMTLGRTVMGWPKSLVSLEPTLTGWLKSPDGATVDLAVSAQASANTYAPTTVHRPMIEIRSPMPARAHFPIDATSPFAPWNMWSNMVKSANSLTRDWMNMFRGMNWMPPALGSSTENMARKTQKMMMGMSDTLLPWAPGSLSNSLNLKQFRLADEPDQYCYQALTNGPLRTVNFNSGGLLGSTWNGDPSGGYIIDLASWEQFPVVDALGLDAEVQPSSSGPSVARVRPVFPFWYDVNMIYDRTETLVSRTHTDGKWKDQAGQVCPSEARVDDALFNTYAGVSTPVIAGPFRLPASTLTVLPLLAYRGKLQDFLDANMNEPLSDSLVAGQPVERFELWCGISHKSSEQQTVPSDLAYVYVVTMLAGDFGSDTFDQGRVGDLSVRIYIPVERKIGNRVVDRGLYPAFSFANDTTIACTLSELLGIPTVRGKFIKRAHAWDGLDALDPHTLLEVQVESMQSLHQGQEQTLEILFEMTERAGGAAAEQTPLSSTAETFCRALLVDLKNKQAVPEALKVSGRIAALKALTLGAPISIYTLKQFRDASRPLKACYQSLVEVRVSVDELHTLDEIERFACFELRHRMSYLIDDQLGLIPRESALVAGNAVHQFEAVRPFRMRASLFMTNGRELRSRSGLGWTLHDPIYERPTPQQLAAQPTGSANKLVAFEVEVSRYGYVDIKRAVDDWLTAQDLTRAELVSGMRQEVADPQSVLESILSREWNTHRGADSNRLSKRAETKIKDRKLSARASIHDKLNILQGLAGVSDLVTFCDLPDAIADLSEVGQLTADQMDFKRPMDSLLKLYGRERFVEFVRQGLTDATPRSRAALTQIDRLRGFGKKAIELVERHQQTNSTWDQFTGVGLVDSLNAVINALLDALIDSATDDKAFQSLKPDHCILRSTGGQEKERFFPLAWCWENQWYAGKEGYFW